ncbi:SulP family inorganic anion transporter [Saccharospirillum salsuginis]|uniref:Sulfate transporter n=1 Tax=Saccharospirillum salsuginis TaxID=418750 RepID=A0A918N6I7_9GAMM|nr:SulP family inorganic anion transporter [Saccharospirillum salsuginis]GGX39849.1 putative sulfate transporter [Saccharospirillum salsuginis]
MKLSLPKAGDLNAGILVALVGIPQCLAYAMLSGLPPMYGLVTAAVPGMVAALVGRSAHVTVGPTNTTGLIILASLAPWADQPDRLLTAMVTLTVLAGLSRLLIVALKAERVFDFVPEAVMLGFATGAAVIIALMQLDEFLGAPFDGVRTVVDEAWRLIQLSPRDLDWASSALAAVALLSVVLGRRYLPRWPIPLLVLVASLALVWFTPFAFIDNWITLEESTVITDGWPRLAGELPNWAMIQALIVPGFAVAFIGSLELIVTLRNRQEQRWLRAELGSQGVANLAGSLVGAFPASTSLTRSVLLDIGGACTRWAPFIAGLILLPIIFYGADLIRAIPQAVIAGLLVATALSMLKPAQIRSVLKANPQTRTLFIVTVVSTLVLSFHEAILLGAALGVVIFLLQASVPQLHRFSVDREGWLHTKPSDETHHYAIQVSGSLYFAAARQLPERLEPMIPDDTERLTLDLSHAHQPRIAAIQALLRFLEVCEHRGIRVDICGYPANLKQIADTMGIRLPWCEARLEQRMVQQDPIAGRLT